VKATLMAVAVAVALSLTACGGGGSSSSASVPEVVSGGTSTWADVTVSTPIASADVPANSRKDLTPLLATRVFDHPASLSEYGLDHPQATLTYKGRTGGTVEVDIGQPNFDRHFLYMQRRGAPAVYLVPADSLRPVLAMVGIDIAPPAS
jgi:hypothetical protein